MRKKARRSNKCKKKKTTHTYSFIQKNHAPRPSVRVDRIDKAVQRLFVCPPRPLKEKGGNPRPQKAAPARQQRTPSPKAAPAAEGDPTGPPATPNFMFVFLFLFLLYMGGYDFTACVYI